MKTVEAVIFNWAGTTVGFGSSAPTTIFKEAFNFEITLDEARGPMGMGKWDHIRTLDNDEAISTRWTKRFGAPLTNEQVTAIYNAFILLQFNKVQQPEHVNLISGITETLACLTQHNIKIGSCSGYPRPVMEAFIPAAEANGYHPNWLVASDDLSTGSRLGPWMALQNVMELGASSVARCIKVDDSVSGIDKGLNTGMWTVGLSLSDNQAGFTLNEFLEANTHYVIDTIEDLPAVLNDINRRIAAGERP